MNIQEIINQLHNINTILQQKIDQEQEWNKKLSADETPVSILTYKRYRLLVNDDEYEQLDAMCENLFDTYTTYKTILFDNELITNTYSGDSDSYNTEDSPSDNDVSNESEEKILSDDEIIAVAEKTTNN